MYRLPQTPLLLILIEQRAHKGTLKAMGINRDLDSGQVNVMQAYADACVYIG